MNKIGDTLIHTGNNKEIVSGFVASAVEFIVIGGLAISWYCPERQADDMDLLVNPTPGNSVRIYEVLNSLLINGISPDSFAKPGLQVPLKHIYYAELLTPIEGGPPYPELAEDAVDAKLFDISVRVASIPALVKMKKQAVDSAGVDRDKHLKDIDLLKQYAV